jgi:CheY-like chemotaxis protein
MKILIVDDNRGFLDVMGDLLDVYGHQVLLAEDGQQASEILEKEHVDLILSDVFMPALDGNRFHSYVRESLGVKDTPFIFYSGYTSQEIQDIVSDSKKDFFLSKSSPVEDVISLIEKLEGSQKDNSLHETPSSDS